MLRRYTMEIAVAQRRSLLQGNRQFLSSSKLITRQRHDLFKPWGVKMVEANGDYRQDTWLEKHIGGPLYENQDKLPRLPVPTISDTLQRFLPTALPLAETKEEKETLIQAVTDFPSQAQVLQERLEQRAKDPEWKDSSWLQLWWNTAGYLQVRDSVAINVSYYFDFADDPSACDNITRGAALLTAAAEVRQKICSGQQPADFVGRGDRRKPLCSTAFKYMFHACRVPLIQEDTYRIFDPALHHHAIVARKGHFFRIEFCDPVSGKPFSLSVLKQTLQTCLEKAEQLEADVPNLPKLGWLTGQTRDECANCRSALLEYGGERMKEALEELESGALLLCLDDEDIVSKQEAALLYLHGGMKSGANRWFDKSLQICVGNNGKAGMLGEHSMMDGMPVINFADHLTRQTYDKCSENGISAISEGQPSVEPIFTPDLYPAMEKAAQLVHNARTAHAEWTGKHSLHVQTFHGYGSTVMKKSGFSPDAFVQMAMQLATYRLWGKQGGTYEATQVRPFLHGRTETTRGVTEQSAEFVKAFGLRPKWDESDPGVCAKKHDLLNKAVLAHVEFIGHAAQAQGVDRHFLGLSMIADGSIPLPDLYSHPVFLRAKRWRVSTSNLTHPKFENWGYGEVVPDGVGLSYSVHPRHCQFSITALKEHGWTDKLAHLLEESLLELRRVIEAKESQDKDKPVSRL